MPKNRQYSIGIDTAFDRKFSYISFGPKNSVDELKRDIEKICIRNGVRKIHFNDIDPDKRSRMYPEIVDRVLRQRNVCYDVLSHVRPTGYPKKDFFTDFLPGEYSKLIRFLEFKSGVIRIDVHDDFGFHGFGDGTNLLLNSLANKISIEFSGHSDEGRMEVFRRDGSVFFKVKPDGTGTVLMFNLRKTVRQESNSIVIADIVPGFHQLKFKSKNKVLPQTSYDRDFLRKIVYKNVTP